MPRANRGRDPSRIDDFFAHSLAEELVIAGRAFGVFFSEVATDQLPKFYAHELLILRVNHQARRAITR